jgi:hypothetical protein
MKPLGVNRSPVLDRTRLIGQPEDTMVLYYGMPFQEKVWSELIYREMVS